MKKNLGRFFIIFLFVFSTNIFASTYEWSASVNKKSAYVDEAIFLKYMCTFSDRSELYSIDFNPVGEHENYTIKPLSEQESIVDGKRVNVFEYVAYAKRSGKIVFDFDMTMKKTNRASIENTVLGRDNEQYEEFTSTYLRQKSLLVDVKRSETDLVGIFDLQIRQSKPSVKAYEAYSLEFIIRGIGNFEELKPITFQIDGVKVFSQKHILESSLKEDGEHGVWSQKFAFVSDKDFVIPSLTFEYFDLEKSSKELLGFKSVTVAVTPAYEKADLLDEVEKSFEFKAEYLYYLLTFLFGFVLAKIKFNKSKKDKTKDELFCQKVQSVKSLEELNMLLAIQSSRKYDKTVLEIERGELTSLKDAKKLICG